MEAERVARAILVSFLDARGLGWSEPDIDGLWATLRQSGWDERLILGPPGEQTPAFAPTADMALGWLAGAIAGILVQSAVDTARHKLMPSRAFSVARFRRRLVENYGIEAACADEILGFVCAELATQGLATPQMLRYLRRRNATGRSAK